MIKTNVSIAYARDYAKQLIAQWLTHEIQSQTPRVQKPLLALTSFWQVTKYAHLHFLICKMGGRGDNNTHPMGHCEEYLDNAQKSA